MVITFFSYSSSSSSPSSAICAPSSSSPTSSSTPRGQTRKQRPQPMHFSSSSVLTKVGVQVAPLGSVTLKVSLMVCLRGYAGSGRCRSGDLAGFHQCDMGVVATLGDSENVLPVGRQFLGQVVQVHLRLGGLRVEFFQARLEFVSIGAHRHVPFTITSRSLQAPYCATAGYVLIISTASSRNFPPASASFASEAKPNRCTSRNCLLTTTSRPAINTMRPKPSWLIFIIGETIWPVWRSIATAIAL